MSSASRRLSTTAESSPLAEHEADAIQRGEIKAVDPRLRTVVLGGILMSFWAPIVMEDWQAPAAAVAQQVTDILMRGIEPRKDGNSED